MKLADHLIEYGMSAGASPTLPVVASPKTCPAYSRATSTQSWTFRAGSPVLCSTGSPAPATYRMMKCAERLIAASACVPLSVPKTPTLPLRHYYRAARTPGVWALLNPESARSNTFEQNAQARFRCRLDFRRRYKPAIHYRCIQTRRNCR